MPMLRGVNCARAPAIVGVLAIRRGRNVSLPLPHIT